MSTTKNKTARKGRVLSAAEFDAKFDRGEDITDDLDLSTARFFAAGEERLDLTSTKVNIDFPKWMVEALDAASDRVGVPRQSLVKMWLAERLEA